jgi:hypothetical protein
MEAAGSDLRAWESSVFFIMVFASYGPETVTFFSNKHINNKISERKVEQVCPSDPAP